MSDKKHGITACLRLINDLQTTLQQTISLANNGVGFGAIKDIAGLLAGVRSLCVDTHECLPEMADLDASEVSQLAGASYGLITNLVTSLAKGAVK